jgi:hypothetical protein
VAAKKGAILAALAPTVPAAIKTEPFSVVRKRSLERPGAVKGAPYRYQGQSRARTLDVLPASQISGTSNAKRITRRRFSATEA